MMRKDPYQDRARELCAAAGIDPESRVGQGRGRPAWCDYREAARVEKVAREQAALAATTKQNPDAPAPIVVGRRKHRRPDEELHELWKRGCGCHLR